MAKNSVSFPERIFLLSKERKRIIPLLDFPFWISVPLVIWAISKRG
jgi:hypothetical protein